MPTQHFSETLPNFRLPSKSNKNFTEILPKKLFFTNPVI
jgi:hypothetical protein